jgi:hypothetical protein
MDCCDTQKVQGWVMSCNKDSERILYTQRRICELFGNLGADCALDDTYIVTWRAI